MKKGVLLSIAFFFLLSELNAQKVLYKCHSGRGFIQELSLKNDGRDMNWILKTDGSQYPWVTDKYGWGLGFFDAAMGNEGIKRYSWTEPVKEARHKYYYETAGIEICVERKNVGNDLVETYIFTNKNNEHVELKDINIFTPFNDNYPDAATCVTSRTNAHIWDGYNAGYVYCSHMNGQAPGLGLVITRGSINGYEIHEKGGDKGSSNFRGVISLVVQNMSLAPGESDRVSWRLFSHMGREDFLSKVLSKGSAYVHSDKYVYTKGEAAVIEFVASSGNELKEVRKNGSQVNFRQKAKNVWEIESALERLGETDFIFMYGNGKSTRLSCWVVSDIVDLMKRRAHFIIDHQQLNNPSHLLDGAYLPYDNEDKKIVLRNKTLSEWIFPDVNRSEGMERLGMGVFLARYYQISKDEKVKQSLLKYAHFVRNRLQDADYSTWCTVGRVWDRAYNYAWTAVFYFEMYKATADKQFLVHGYQTLQAMFRHFGHGFYAIEIPVRLSLTLLKEAGMQTEYEQLKKDFIEMGDTFIKNGINYPKHEVAYEQTIVGPSVFVLTELYLMTREQRFLDEAKKQMPLLMSFDGFQPSHRLNGLPIRHWDAFWCGKYQTWGDTFPHFLSGFSGIIYYDYYLCTGDETFKRMAENNVRNTLSLFFEDGSASMAFIYPNKVNGEKTRCYDAFANEQDWALAYYILVNSDTLLK